MKKLFLAVMASLFLFASCGKKAEHSHDATDSTAHHHDHADSAGTHTHADGRVHKNHEPKDSTAQDTTAHRHSHEH